MPVEIFVQRVLSSGRMSRPSGVCCPPRKKPLIIRGGDPCALVEAPTVVSVTNTTEIENLCGSVMNAEGPVLIDVVFSKLVEGVTECSGTCAAACRNIRIFRCTAGGACANPETELELIPDSIAFNPATFTATVTLNSFGPGATDPGARIVVGDNPLCPITEPECEKTLTPFRCDFTIHFAD